jgi:hypothetical protein
VDCDDNLAVVLRNVEKEDEDLDLNRQAFPQRKEILGLKHSETLRSLQNLAMSLEKRDNPEETEEAEQMYCKVFEGRMEIFGHEHPDTLYSLKSLAEYLKKNLKIRNSKNQKRTGDNA